MTVYTTPPTYHGLVLHQGDTLDITDLFSAFNTRVERGGALNVYSGESVDTTVDFGGSETVHASGVSSNTVDRGFQLVEGVSHHTIVEGGLEKVDFGGVSYDTTVLRGAQRASVEIVEGTSVDTFVGRGAAEKVEGGGVAINTTLASGTLQVSEQSLAENVTFAASRSKLELASPTGLVGVISHWQAGDTVVLQNTHVTSVSETGNVLTVDYGHNQSVKYTLANQQPDTHVTFFADRSGGTDLVLTTGVQHLHHGDFFV